MQTRFRKLPLTDVPKGSLTLRVATRLGAGGQSVVAQEAIQIVD